MEGSPQVDEKTKEEYEEKARVDKERYLKEEAPEISAAELRALFAAHGGRIAMGVALRHFAIKEKGTHRFKQLVQLLKEYTTTVEKGKA